MEHVREQLTDDELVDLVLSGKISSHRLEALTGNPDRAVLLRRRILTLQLSRIAHINGPLLEHIPHSNYPFEKVMGQCCENVIGYLTMPLGVVGPLMVDGLSYWVPMATTEGALIASVQRGSKALLLSGGVSTIMYGDGMTRGPVIQFPSIQDVCSFKSWVDNPLHFDDLVKVFNNTSRYTKLLSLDVAPAGVDVFLRFKASTGDAMGMNMVSKGTERTLSYLSTLFPRMRVISLSGNYCTDKKAASLNWIDGRGKSIIAEAVLSAETVQTILKVTPEQLVKTHLKKNFKGSAMAGSLGGGGFNAQASNVVTAIFLATGQDPAQNVESSNCITIMERYAFAAYA